MDEDEILDDGLDDLLSQVEIVDPQQPQPQKPLQKSNKNDDVFKKPAQPKYSYNKFQHNRSDMLSQGSQSQRPVTTNKSNQIQTNKAYQSNQSNQNKLNQPNKPSNQQTFANRSNAQSTSNATSSTASNHSKTSNNETFVKPLQPNHQVNSNQNSNLAKSLKAAQSNNNQPKKSYSINKQNLAKFNKQITQSDYQPASSNSSAISNQTTTSTNKTCSSQSTLNNQTSSQSKVLSQFNITDHTSAEVSFNPALKKQFDLNDQGIDPSDKYLGRIELITKKCNEMEKELHNKDDKLAKQDSLIAKLKDALERKNEEMKTVQYFNDKERKTREFKDTVLNTTIDKSSPILNKTISSTTYQLKKQSPKLKSNKFATQLSQNRVRTPQDEKTLQPDDFENMDLDDTMSDDCIIPETQVPLTPKSGTPTSLNETNSRLDLSTVRPSQLDEVTVHFKTDNQLIDSDDDDENLIIPATQESMCVQESSPKFEHKQKMVPIKEEPDSPRLETNKKRIKIDSKQPTILEKDDAVFHQTHFKFIDLQVYDYLDNRNEISFFLENVNPQYDLILEKIDKESLLKFFKDSSFKFSKLNEQLILTFLFDFHWQSNIPELTFNLLTTLNRYNCFLDDKQLLSKLTNKCRIVDLSSNNRYRDGHTLINKILDVLTSCKIDDADNPKDYQLLCYSIILFLIQNTVDNNNINAFHRFSKDSKDECQCWKEIYDALGEFALYILDQFDIKNDLHVLIVKDLSKFVLNLNRTNFRQFQTRNCLGYARFSYFVHKMYPKLKYCYLDYLCGD